MQSGRIVGAPSAGADAAARNVGGARIVAPRAKISTMLIAAPQCGQTKLGATLAKGASGGGDSVAAGTTCGSRVGVCVRSRLGEDKL